MSQIDHLLLIIQHVMQAQDSAIRKEAQSILLFLRNEKPNALMHCYIKILAGTYKLQYRNFAVFQLRLCLSDAVSSKQPNYWIQLNLQVKKIVKDSLFNILEVQSDLLMKKNIAGTIGKIAGAIISRGQPWLQFKVLVWKLFNSTNLGSNLAGFYILESFVTVAPEYFKQSTSDIYILIQAALKTEHSQLRVSALRLLASYFQVLEPKALSNFHQLIPNILKSVQKMVFKDQSKDGLEALSQMLVSETIFFKKYFEDVISLLIAIYHHERVQRGVKRMAIEILVDYTQNSPNLFKKNMGVIQQVIEIVLIHMADLSPNIQEGWLSPPQGYKQDQEDDDFESTKFGMSAIDRIIDLGEEKILPLLWRPIETYLRQNDQRYKYAGVMALSQVGENLTRISQVIAIITGFVQHQNPIMRYAFCHAIGQISDKMQPRFQIKYGQALLPELISLLNDPVPRVVQHSAAALTNFIQGLQIEQLNRHLPTLVQILLNHAISGISIVKESCVVTLSSIVLIAKESYAPYLAKTVEVLFSFFESDKYAGQEYRILKGRSIQTLTITASKLGTTIFAGYGPILMDILINLLGSEFQKADILINYIFSGWQRLCLLYGKGLSGQLNQILPSLLQLVERLVNDEIEALAVKQNGYMKDNHENIKIYETEKVSVAISMIRSFIEQLSEVYNPYAVQTVILFFRIIKEHPIADAKQEACKSIVSLILGIKDTQPLDAIKFLKIFMETLVQNIEKQFNSSNLKIQLETLVDILRQLNFSFLSQEELTIFIKKNLQLLKTSDFKRQGDLAIHYQEMDEEEIEIAQQKIQEKEEMLLVVSQLIGALLNTHKTLNAGFSEYLIKDILPNLFSHDQTENKLKFGISLINDMMEHLGYESLSASWSLFEGVLVRYTTNKSCVVRQAACYGLGIYAENIPQQFLTKEKAQQWIGVLLEAIKVPKRKEKERTYKHCSDNAVSAIGKIIKAHGNIFNPQEHVKIWMDFLPLRFDKQQGLIQSELLSEIMEKNPMIVLGSNHSEGLKKVLTIYAIIVGSSKFYNSSISKKIKKQVLELRVSPLYKQTVTQIWQTLSDKQREDFEDFME